MKRLFLYSVLILCGILAMAQTKTSSHVVSSGETLYSISRQYGVTVNDILNSNPNMTENIMAGQTIKIPTVSSSPELHKQKPCKTTHVVLKKETIYGIAHQYGITEEELIEANPAIQNGKKLKKGFELCIPFSASEKKSYREQQAQTMEKIEAKRQESLVKYYDVLKIAVIAPFGLSDARRSSEAKKVTDFYKGFLMAVDTLKHKGISCEIYTYEEPAQDGLASNILSQPMLKNVNLIIGPFKPGNALQIAKFAAENNILMVMPTSSRGYDMSMYGNVYQYSAPSNLVYENVYNKFALKYASKNIVFVSMNDSKDNTIFNSRFKESLSHKGVSYKSVDISDIDALKSALSVEKANILIPSSPSEAAFKSITSKLKSIQKDTEIGHIQLFGYPEWQTYTKHRELMNKYSATFYTTFFSNPSNYNVQSFNKNFVHWFNNPQIISFPKYGELGFDMGYFFINALHQNGSKLLRVAPARYEGMLSTYNFHKNSEQSSAINNSIMFVRYNGDDTYTVER